MSISEAALMRHFHHHLSKSLLNKYSVVLSTFSHCRILFLLASSNPSITAGFLHLSSLGVLTVIVVFLLKIFSSLGNTLSVPFPAIIQHRICFLHWLWTASFYSNWHYTFAQNIWRGVCRIAGQHLTIYITFLDQGVFCVDVVFIIGFVSSSSFLFDL